jgi:hypothetical protein
MSRKPASSIIAICFALVSLAATGETPKKSVNKQSVPSAKAVDVEVEGQVFIVTKNQNAIKLALVPIYVISEQELQVFALARMNELNQARMFLARSIRETQEKVAAYERDPLLTKRLTIEKEIKAHTDNCTKTTNGAWREFDKCINTPEYLENFRQRNSLGPVTDDQVKKLAQQQSTLSDLKEQFDKRSSNPDFFAPLNSRQVKALAIGKTDADGKFNIKFAASSRVAVFAKATREVSRAEHEEYVWLVWLPTSKSGGKVSLLLANDNLIDLECSGCVHRQDFASDLLKYSDILER